MKVNKAFNSVYRFYEQNPETMRDFAKKTESLMKDFASKMTAETVILDAKTDPMLENPTLAKFFEKIGKLAMRPVFGDLASSHMSKTKSIDVLETDYIGSIKTLNSLKAGIRKALRKDPEANTMAKEIIEDMKKPENKAIFEPLNQFIKSFAPSNSESITNIDLDMASLAPKEIRSDYLKLIQHKDKVLNTPADNLYINILNSLVKK